MTFSKLNFDLFHSPFPLQKVWKQNEKIWLVRSPKETARVSKHDDLLSSQGVDYAPLQDVTCIRSMAKSRWGNKGSDAEYFPSRCSQLVKRRGDWGFLAYRLAFHRSMGIQWFHALDFLCSAAFGMWGRITVSLVTLWGGDRMIGDWLQYSDLTFSLNAPVGHLSALVL